MGFFKKLFGGKSFDEHRRDADAHFAAGRYGEAKLAYDRALDAGKEAPKEAVDQVRDRIQESRDRIAEERIAAGDDMRKEGEIELARAEYEGAIDTAASGEIVDRARRLLEDLDAREVTQAIAEAAAATTAQTDEERWAMITAHWSDAQIEEYDEYGEEARQAILALDQDEGEKARPILEALVAKTQSPRFLWSAVGRARLATKDEAGAVEAFRKFLAAVTEDEETAEEAKDARLAVHLALSGILDSQGDVEGAVGELQTAMDAFEDDYRPYLALGRYLRKTGAPKEAAQVLEAALPFVGEARPDLGVAQELGLAHADAGDDDKAVEALETVVAALVARKALDFPADSISVLARLHEKAGRKDRAADLWASLARGTDPRRIEFHRNAARLLTELGLDDEARRLLQRAVVLAEKDPAEKKLVDEQLAALD